MDPDRLVSLFAFTILALLWIGFLYALVANRGLLDRIWRAFRELPVLVQVILGLLFLPVVLSLWIWQVKWPAIIRLLLVAGLAWVTLYTFYPAAAAAF